MSGCRTCPANNDVGLRRMGVHTDESDFVVALAGNPNTGKSTVFNALTGLRQHTGNWPGKTVTRAEGGFAFGPHTYRIIDLPGTYSLLASSTDEEVARDFLLFGRPDVTVVVLDATRLERNLNLALQIVEITDRVVVCLNLMDEARRRGLVVDERRLSRDLGVPVVPTAARRREGIDRLLHTIRDVATGETTCKPRRVRFADQEINDALDSLVPKIEERFPGIPNARWIAARMIEGDESVLSAVKQGTLGQPAGADALSGTGQTSKDEVTA